MLLRGGAPKNMLGDRGVGGAEGLGRDQSPRFVSEESANAWSRSQSGSCQQQRERENRSGSAHNSIANGARMMVKNNLLDDRVVRKIIRDRNNQNILAVVDLLANLQPCDSLKL